MEKIGVLLYMAILMLFQYCTGPFKSRFNPQYTDLFYRYVGDSLKGKITSDTCLLVVSSYSRSGFSCINIPQISDLLQQVTSTYGQKYPIYVVVDDTGFKNRPLTYLEYRSFYPSLQFIRYESTLTLERYGFSMFHVTLYVLYRKKIIEQVELENDACGKTIK